MALRVLANGEARAAVRRLQRTIDGDLRATIDSILQQGQILESKNNWDGSYSDIFRGEWDWMEMDMKDFLRKYGEMAQSIDQITANIMAAGGN
jgi:uncharacterized protein YukE